VSLSKRCDSGIDYLAVSFNQRTHESRDLHGSIKRAVRRQDRRNRAIESVRKSAGQTLHIKIKGQAECPIAGLVERRQVCVLAFESTGRDMGLNQGPDVVCRHVSLADPPRFVNSMASRLTEGHPLPIAWVSTRADLEERRAGNSCCSAVTRAVSAQANVT
jgi:hypothetical protein